MNENEKVLYVVHSDVNENNILQDFEDLAAALEYAKDNIDEQTYIEEVVCDEDGETIYSTEVIWAYDEDDAEYQTVCEWCGDLVYESECRKELNLGLLCSQCQSALYSRGEKPVFEEAYITDEAEGNDIFAQEFEDAKFESKYALDEFLDADINVSLDAGDANKVSVLSSYEKGAEGEPLDEFLDADINVGFSGGTGNDVNVLSPLGELGESVNEFRSLPKMTVAEIKEALDNDMLDFDEELEESDEDGWRSSDHIVFFYNAVADNYISMHIWIDQEGGYVEAPTEEVYENFEELLYAIDSIYADITDLDAYIGSELAEALEEATHAQYAKPEGDKVAAYNNALKYAKKNNADYIYGYTNYSGKFFALEQPIKMSDEAGKTESEFRNKYKNCRTVYVAYQDKDFIKESLEHEDLTPEQLADIEKYLKTIGDLYLEDYEQEYDFAIDIVGGNLTYTEKTNTFDFYLSIYHASEDNNAENVEYHTDEEEYSFDTIEEVYDEFPGYLEDIYKWNASKISKIEEAIQMTRDELVDKEGTDDVELINAGRPEEERVELSENCTVLDKNEKFELAESQSQEISNAYRQLSKEYGRDMEELVYGPNGFMATKYPNGLPDFSGDIIYSEKYWAEFEEWLEAQDSPEQAQARLQEADINSTTIKRPEAPKDLSVVKEPGDPSISEGDLVWFNTHKGEDVVIKIIKFTKNPEGQRDGCRAVYTEPRVTRPHKDTYKSQYFGNK